MSTVIFPEIRLNSGLAVLAAGQLLALSALAGINAREAPWQFIALYAVGFLFYLGSVRSTLRSPHTTSLAMVLIITLLLRLIALHLDLRLSDDIYRYLWEGKIGAQGFSPYRYAPSSPTLDALDDPTRHLVNHPEIPGVYPPLAQALFRLANALAYHPWSHRLLFTAFDVLTVVLAARLLARAGLPASLTLVYAWNPLPVLEFGSSGHLDSAGIALMFAALLTGTSSRPRPLATAALLAGSSLIKPLSIALAPVFAAEVARRDGTSRAVAFVLVFLGTCAIAYMPYRADGIALLEGVSQYAHRWSFNGSVFPLARAWLGEESARRVMVYAFAGIVLACTLRRVPPVRAAFLSMTGFFILSPTAHPWYLCWTLPFLPLFPGRAWLFFSGAVVLSYAVFSGNGGWEEQAWVRWVEYLPFFVLLAADAWKARREAWGQGCG